ncbi:uncharacterized protein [Venturia canescens]|uniref:uncharacterized protein n=1 Tax=Venturia canescens TaxID=32260 RepID=UPI001C9D0D3E|nr:uncharacterized protein LOC122419296 [Venturia canescens]
MDSARNPSKTRIFHRMKKMYASIGPKQLRITSFFPIEDKLRRLVRENEQVRNTLRTFMEHKSVSTVNLKITQCAADSSSSQSNFLLSLFRSANNKCSEAKKVGNRYNEAFKLFSTYLFTIGGRMLYETLYANLPIPSLSTISRVIGNSGCDIKEGVCRAKELKEFLVGRNLPLIVWVSEDATRITGRIQYDTRSNQLVGFVLPLNQKGMPVCGTYPATSASKIVENFEKGTIASLAYVIIAQPLIENAPSFCLSIFGTDNKFYATDVLNRWKYIISCLKKEGITVFGISSDGDPRLLKAMRVQSQLGTNSTVDTGSFSMRFPYFHASCEPEVIFIQDTIHIGAKLRTRLLKPSIILPMGNFIITASHLKILMDTVSKDKHCLNQKDLSPKDKMNYASVEKISDPKIIDLLKHNVPGSEATTVYLQIMHLFMSAFLKKDMKPLDRVYNCWFSIFVLRMWRAWLNTVPQYSVSDNFLSLNTYLCMEMNAHGLVNSIMKLKKITSSPQTPSEMFLPWQFSSQPCESFFRLLRSMSTTYSTIVNSTLLETIYRVKRIQLQDDIASGNLHDESAQFNYPRAKVTGRSTLEQSSLPEVNDIFEIIEQAKKDALTKVQSLGINMGTLECDTVSMRCNETGYEKKDSEEEIEYIEESNIEVPSVENDVNGDREPQLELLQDLSILSNAQGSLLLKNYEQYEIKLQPDSPFVVVKDNHNKELVVRKSSICWLLQKNSSNLSSDRLQRVRESELNTFVKRGQYKRDDKCFIKKNDEIHIGDWCLFKKKKVGKGSPKCFMGLVLNFAYTDGTTKKSQEYSSHYARVKENTKEIGVLCNWYEIVPKSPDLVPVPMDVHGFISIKQYCSTISSPSMSERGLHIDMALYKKIKHFF